MLFFACLFYLYSILLHIKLCFRGSKEIWPFHCSIVILLIKKNSFTKEQRKLIYKSRGSVCGRKKLRKIFDSRWNSDIFSLRQKAMASDVWRKANLSVLEHFAILFIKENNFTKEQRLCLRRGKLRNIPDSSCHTYFFAYR
jgi:hypothetical protein